MTNTRYSRRSTHASVLSGILVLLRRLFLDADGARYLYAATEKMLCYQDCLFTA